MIFWKLHFSAIGWQSLLLQKLLTVNIFCWWDANFNNLKTYSIVWAIFPPILKDKLSIVRENYQFEELSSVLCVVLKSMFLHWLINQAITHRKLPPLQCYHIFSSTSGIYSLPKIIMKTRKVLGERRPPPNRSSSGVCVKAEAPQPSRATTSVKPGTTSHYVGIGQNVTKM